MSRPISTTSTTLPASFTGTDRTSHVFPSEVVTISRAGSPVRNVFRTGHVSQGEVLLCQRA